MNKTAELLIAVFVTFGGLTAANADILQDLEEAAKDVVEGIVDVGTSAWDGIGELGQGAACYAALSGNPYAVYAYMEVLAARAAGEIRNRGQCETLGTEAARLAKLALDRGVSADVSGWLWTKCLCLAAFPDGGGKSPPPPPLPPEPPPSLDWSQEKCTVDRLTPIISATADAFVGEWGDATFQGNSKIFVKVSTDKARNLQGKTLFGLTAWDTAAKECQVETRTSTCYATMSSTTPYQGNHLTTTCGPSLLVDRLRPGVEGFPGRLPRPIPGQVDAPSTKQLGQGQSVPGNFPRDTRLLNPTLPPKSIALTNIPNNIEVGLYGAYCGESFQGYWLRYMRRNNEGAIVNDMMLQPSREDPK